MKKSTFILLIMTILLASCLNERKQSNQENDKERENQIARKNSGDPILKSPVKVGQILVAQSTIEDPTFLKSVILVALIREGKVYGLILNKGTNEQISNYIKNVNRKDIPIGYGGPVNDDFVYIQTFDSTSKNSMKIMNGLYLMGDINIIKDKIQQNAYSKNEIRFFKGTTIWNIEQLEKEINEWRDWKIIDLNISEIMGSNMKNLWEKYQ